MKPKKRQRWLCKNESASSEIIVEVLKTHLYDPYVELKVVQVFKGDIAKPGQILKNELFSEKYDTYLVGQDASK